MRLTPTIVIALAGAGAAAGPASAESWEFTFSRQTLTPEEPSTTVTLWASFSRLDWAFSGALLEVHATEPQWSDLTTLLDGPGQAAGELHAGGRSVIDMRFWNAWTFGSGPDPSNPLAVWEATFTSTDFSTQRDVVVSTLTDRYEVYAEYMGRRPEPRTPIDIETTIRVIPAPAPLALLGLGALVAGRPRRNGRSAR